LLRARAAAAAALLVLRPSTTLGKTPAMQKKSPYPIQSDLPPKSIGKSITS